MKYKPLKPEDIIAARQDTVHKDIGKARTPKVTRVPKADKKNNIINMLQKELRFTQRMLEWAKTQDPDEYPEVLDMKYAIGIAPIDSPLCNHFKCSECPMEEECTNKLFDFSESTWWEWMQDVRRAIKGIESAIEKQKRDKRKREGGL